MVRNIKNNYGLDDIFSHSWEVFTKNFGLLMLAGLVIYLPINLLFSIVPTYWSEMGGMYQLYYQLATAVQGLLSFIAVLAIIHIAFSKITAKKVSFGSAIGMGFKRLFPGILTYIVEAIIIGLIVGIPIVLTTLYFMFAIFQPIALFIIIGILLVLVCIAALLLAIKIGVQWIFAYYSVVIDKTFAFKALRNSADAIKGRWWKVFGITLLLGLLSGAITMPFGIALAFFDYYVVKVFILTLTQLISIYFLVAYTVFFVNLYNTKKLVKKTKK